MKIFHYLNKVALMMLIALPCLANANIDNAKVEVVKRFYSSYFEEEGDGWDSSLTSDLRNVFAEDEACAQEDLCAINYDVFIQGQDLDAEEIKRSLKYQLQPNGTVKVTFTNFGTPVTLYYVLLCENGRCLIDDMLGGAHSPFKSEVRKELEEIKKLKTMNTTKK